jgi:subtilisin family serine protease
MSQLRGMGARELARVHVAHNAVAVRVQAQSLSTIAALPGVAMVRPVLNYELALSDTVPYVGAANAQAAGKDGTGVRVAVLDSGIDYTHYNLGGAGTPEAYAAAYGSGSSDAKNTTRDGLFPTAKVVDGYDFVGEVWPNGPLAEDDDPIDAPASGDTQGGHGTHVADIIGGHSADGVHKGVAPGAALVAVKVCSSVATSCSGVALLKGMDFALDPNGDGDLSDAVDVINMSLGSNYGQVEDDLSQASADAVKLGVVVVAAAGNAANRPYIVSSPSTAPGVISVAQTAVPSDKAYPLTVNSPPAIAGIYPNTATVDWAPIGAGFSGTVAAVGRGCPAAGATPEDPYLADPAGKVALIDRGVCAISLKVDRAARAGAIGVLLGLVAPGDAVSFSFGGGTMFVPTLVIQQSLSNAIKANPPANVSVGNVSIAQVGSMIGSSARGPSVSFSAIKPEIGAPGASVSAVVGTGNGQEAFGGTSGATPMVAGAAAILVQAFPQRSPEQIKALLMNSAETNINTNNALAPGVLAPITRIGAGELRVDRALALGSAARERKDQSASLSFGFQNVSSFKTLHKRLLIENFDRNGKVYAVDTNFRYANDEANGAVRIFAPPRVFVPGHGKREIDISLLIDGRKLPDWTLDGGPNGGNGALLEGVEYDGYVTLTAGDEKLSVPWQVLPRKSADFSADTYRTVKAGQSFRLANRGVTVGDFDVFSLTGISRRADGNDLPQPGDNFAFIDLRAVGVRLAAPGILQFALNTFGRRAHPNYPAEFDVAIDVNRDGNDDFVVFNAELGGFGATGQNVVSVVNLTTGQVRTFFYIDADLQSANAILTVPTAALGITDDTTFDFAVYAFDNYFTGNLTDSFGTMTYTPTTPRFVATDLPAAGVAPRSAVRIGTAAVAGGDVASPSQLGLLLMYRLDAGREAEIIRMR